MMPASHIEGMVRAAANVGGPPVPITETLEVRCLATSLIRMERELTEALEKAETYSQAVDRLALRVVETDVKLAEERARNDRLVRQLREADGEIEDSFWRAAGAA